MQRIYRVVIDDKYNPRNRIVNSLGIARNIFSQCRRNGWYGSNGGTGLSGGQIQYADVDWRVLDKIEANGTCPWHNTNLQRAKRLRLRAEALLKEATELESKIKWS